MKIPVSKATRDAIARSVRRSEVEEASPLAGRPGLRTESPETNTLARDIGLLARKHNLSGCVLISFTKDERVGVNSSGEPDMFGLAMERLGDQILAAIDDGKFDPDPQIVASADHAPGRG